MPDASERARGFLAAEYPEGSMMQQLVLSGQTPDDYDIAEALRAIDQAIADERAAEQGRIVAFLRNQLIVLPRNGADASYRMGQNDALRLAIDAIESAAHLPCKSSGDK